MDLRGKVTFITGGRRVGRELARELAQRGARLAITYHSSRDIAEETQRECEALGAEVLLIAADLRQKSAGEAVIRAVVKQWHRVDVLVNLVSIYERTPLAELTPEKWQEVIEVNLLAPSWVALAVAQQMLTQSEIAGIRGKIIHFTDWACSRPYRDFAPYLAAKGALETLTRTLAVELAPSITVNAIAPGTVEPPPHLTEQQQQTIINASALQRLGSPADVNRAVLYLLEGSDFVTGEILRIDGGRFLGAVGQSTIADA